MELNSGYYHVKNIKKQSNIKLLGIVYQKNHDKQLAKTSFGKKTGH